VPRNDKQFYTSDVANYPFDVAKDWGRSDGDQRHRLVLSGSVHTSMEPGSKSLPSTPSSTRLANPPTRAAITGSFSVKLRAGYDHPEQIFSLLPLFEGAEIDFLVLHPRTVVQKYSGLADHAITARVVERTALPVIANGDIVSAAQGRQILAKTKAAGLMLGRGAIADPLLFARLRGTAPEEPDAEELQREFVDYLSDLLVRYEPLFCGEQQILAKLKEVPAFVTDPRLLPLAQQLRRARTLQDFRALLKN